jgi:anti-sigma B factor antagonist
MGKVGAFVVSVADGSSTVVQLRGELDVAGVPKLKSVLAELDGDIELHCADLEFIDAAGLGVFVAAHNACARRGAKLVVVDPSRQLLRLLALTELDTVLSVRQDRESP